MCSLFYLLAPLQSTPAPLWALLCLILFPQEADYCSVHHLGCLTIGFQLHWAKGKGMQEIRRQGWERASWVFLPFFPFCNPCEDSPWRWPLLAPALTEL